MSDGDDYAVVADSASRALCHLSRYRIPAPSEVHSWCVDCDRSIHKIADESGVPQPTISQFQKSQQPQVVSVQAVLNVVQEYGYGNEYVIPEVDDLDTALKLLDVTIHEACQSMSVSSNAYYQWKNGISQPRLGTLNDTLVGLRELAFRHDPAFIQLRLPTKSELAAALDDSDRPIEEIGEAANVSVGVLSRVASSDETDDISAQSARRILRTLQENGLMLDYAVPAFDELDTLREHLDLSVSDLAEQANYHRTAYYNWRNDRTPRLSSLRSTLDVLRTQSATQLENITHLEPPDLCSRE